MSETTTTPAPADEFQAAAVNDCNLYVLVALGGIDELAPQTVPVFEKE